MSHDWSDTFTGDEIAVCARCGLLVKYVVDIAIARANSHPHPRALQWFQRSGESQWTTGGNGLPKCRAKGGA